MSNFYEYERVGVRIAHRLMKLNGWKVYGYHADESDMMTDYYNPAYWNGTAEKNGYVLVFNHSSASKGRSYSKTNRTAVSAENAEKIRKLERMTVSRGATVFEEETAKRKIAAIMEKAAETKEVTETIIYELPHLANPPRCNWHIEKDGIIIDKGTGLLKFEDVWDITQDRYLKKWQDINNMPKDDWKKNYISGGWNYGFTDEEAERAYNQQKKEVELLEKFNELINRIDTTCGGMIGKGGRQEYEKVVKTVYKTENKVHETANGSIEVGQHFVLKHTFNYGCSSGFVYRITDVFKDKDGNITYFTAYKLNGKLTKLCTGNAKQSNRFGGSKSRFENWINRGAIAYCDIVEEKIPYEVEKMVKVKRGA